MEKKVFAAHLLIVIGFIFKGISLAMIIWSWTISDKVISIIIWSFWEYVFAVAGFLAAGIAISCCGLFLTKETMIVPL